MGFWVVWWVRGGGLREELAWELNGFVGLYVGGSCLGGRWWIFYESTK